MRRIVAGWFAWLVPSVPTPVPVTRGTTTPRVLRLPAGRTWGVRLLVAMCAGATLTAQAAIVQFDQQIFAPGVNPATGNPIQTNTYLAAAVTCNQLPVPVPASVSNPTKFEFDDPANAGKVCIGTLASALLPALPSGVGYVATMTQTDNLGQTSVRSAASNPFNRQAPPLVLTGVKVIP